MLIALSGLIQIILPFSLAFLCIISYAYDLDPLMVFWGVSETVSIFMTSYLGGFWPNGLLAVRRLSGHSVYKNLTLKNCYTDGQYGECFSVL